MLWFSVFTSNFFYFQFSLHFLCKEEFMKNSFSIFDRFFSFCCALDALGCYHNCFLPYFYPFVHFTESFWMKVDSNYIFKLFYSWNWEVEEMLHVNFIVFLMFMQDIWNIY